VNGQSALQFGIQQITRRRPMADPQVFNPLYSKSQFSSTRSHFAANNDYIFFNQNSQSSSHQSHDDNSSSKNSASKNELLKALHSQASDD